MEVVEIISWQFSANLSGECSGKISKTKLVHDKLVKNFKKNLKYKGHVEYSFSHFELQTKVFFKIIEKNNFPKSQWIKKEKIEKSGLPTVMKKIVQVAV